MIGLYIIRRPLCRLSLARSSHIFKRCKFSGRANLVSKPKASSLPTEPARTRFAPSPTGYVHIGSLRTALYNYLLAKATGGQFLLRVEDTDQSRIVQDAERRLYEDLRWAGLSWDEGPDVGGQYGPYKQSERLEIYKKHADQLLGEGHAYRCFCTPEDLDQMRSLSIQEGRPTIYNRTCSHIPPDVSARRAANGEPHCTRFKCDQQPFVDDLVYGHYTKPEPEDDFIIVKRDGYPTYHFANVVDDHLMKITHVIRGAEWLVSTPRHVALYNAFGWQQPQFAHVGLLVNKEKQKLSKRHGDVDIASWRDRGILPIALLNYVMLLGWSLGKGVKGRQEVMDLDEMVSKFTLGFTKGDITVNDKHEFLQMAHVKRTDPASFLDKILPVLEAHVQQVEAERGSISSGSDSTSNPHITVAQLGPLIPPARAQDGSDALVSREYVRKVLEFDHSNFTNIRKYMVRIWYLIWEVPEPLYCASFERELGGPQRIFSIEQPPAQDARSSPLPETSRALQVSELTATLRDLLLRIDDEQWTIDGISKAIMPFLLSVQCTSSASDSGQPQQFGYHLIRWIIAASLPGPSVILSMVVLGREESMKRVEKAIEVAKEMEGKQRGEIHKS
ncbi:hypothetical protein GGR54DRAFT_583460 [Hypoxylon sp. NC1633]|nr:hypothetical protein GGR54DRAFT_583460 [Hypoxylon sp. NC1633]